MYIGGGAAHRPKSSCEAYNKLMGSPMKSKKRGDAKLNNRLLVKGKTKLLSDWASMVVLLLHELQEYPFD